MISPELFCARFALSAAPPHQFRLEGAGDLLLHVEAGQCTAALLAAHAALCPPAQMERALALAERLRDGPDLFLSQLTGGNLCFHVLSPGEGDESEAAAALVEQAVNLLRAGDG